MENTQQLSSTEPQHQTAFPDEPLFTTIFKESFEEQEEENQLLQRISSEDTEWDPIEFDQQKKSDPKWKLNKNSTKQTAKRIQDIILTRLDSGESNSSDNKSNNHISEDDNYLTSDDDDWPYEIGVVGSPCALFGTKIMTSSPAEGFDGEFSKSGDPEWENGSGSGSGSRDKARSRRPTSNTGRRSTTKLSSSSNHRRNKQTSQQQSSSRRLRPNKVEDDEDEHDEASLGSNFESQHSESSSDSEYCESVTDSPGCDEDDNLMITPAIGKSREVRKKPPTLKRGQHQVTTPSVVKALRGKQAFGSDDEGDNEHIDFDTEESDMEGGSSGHSRSRSRDSRRSKREQRLEAAHQSFRGSKKFDFDRSKSQADLKAARKANNSFKGGQMSFSALEVKRRAAQRKKDGMTNSYSSSTHSTRRGGSGKSPIQSDSNRKVPLRAKSLGDYPAPAAAAGGSKLKSALSKFAGTDASEGAPKEPKKLGSTLSALKVLSGAGMDSGGGGKGGGLDLKAAIMQQVHRSSSGDNPIELKIKPKPKLAKTLSLSSSGMARAAAASGDFLSSTSSTTNKAPARIQRSKTDIASGSYHESIAKLRRQRMADASERSAGTLQSAASQESQDSASPKRRPAASRGRAKSFEKPRSGARLNASEDVAKNDATSPGVSKSGERPRLSRGGSRRLKSSEIEESPAAGRPQLKRGGSRRLQVGEKSPSLRKSGSRRRLQVRPDYDATFHVPSGENVLSLLKQQQPASDAEMLQKGNRQMLHALMFKTRMGMDMGRLQQKVDGLASSEESNNGQSAEESEGEEEED